MQVPPLHAQVTTVVRELGQYHGYRTVWIDQHGHLCHSEPEEELEHRGYHYVATLMRPDEDALSEAVSRFATLHPERHSLRVWARRSVATDLVTVGA
jgi:hypothetical protein